MSLAQQVAHPDRAATIAEVYYVAATRYEVAAYADFLTQLVRFDENVLRLLCLQQGVQFVNYARRADESGAFINRAWLRSLAAPLPKDRDDGRNRPSGRKTLFDLVKHLAQLRNEAEPSVLALSQQLEQLVYLRNETTHSLNGVQREDLATRFRPGTTSAADADGILPHMAAMYAVAVGQSLGASPYGVINELVADLLQERVTPARLSS